MTDYSIETDDCEECFEAEESRLELRISDDEDSTDGERDTTGAVTETAILNSSEMDLLAAAKDASDAFYLYLDDKHDEAIEMIKSKGDTCSVYHSVSLGAMLSFKALLTFDPASIAEALEVIRKSLDICNSQRRKYTLTSNALTNLIFSPNYNEYTEEEIHAELCFAECLLMRTTLTCINDTSLLSLIKGGFKVRQGHQIYKECQQILKHRTWQNAELRGHFESGVNMGIGAFNLCVSAVPARYLAILQLVGFSGDRELALEKLKEGLKQKDSLRSPLCSIILILYNLFGKVTLGNHKGNEDISYAEQLITPLKLVSPGGVPVRFLTARLDHVKGHICGAIDKLESTLAGRPENYRLHHAVAWELYLCYSTLGQWRKAVGAADILWKESQWSRCVFAYMKATALFMCDDLTEQEQTDMVDLMRAAPTFLQKFIGRGVPVEKYFSLRAKRFLEQDNFLVLPVYEMMYMWNLFYIIRGDKQILGPMMERIDRTIEQLNEERYKAFDWCEDNYCLAIFLKGLCLRYTGKTQQAQELFQKVVEKQTNICEDTQVVSFAQMELGFIYKEREDYDRAIQCLTAARSFSIFLTEFRIHSAIEEIKSTGYYNKLMEKDVSSPNDFW